MTVSTVSICRCRGEGRRQREPRGVAPPAPSAPKGGDRLLLACRRSAKPGGAGGGGGKLYLR